MRAMGVVSVAVLAACVACSRSSSGGASEPLVIGASDLVQAYKADPKRADAVYKGRRVRVSGVVGEVRRGLPVSLTLGREGDADVAECFFADDQAKGAAMLTKGVKLTIECECEGLQTNVVLRKCTLGGASAADASAGTSALDVCKKLDEQGLAAKCRAGEGTGDTARFDIPSLPGKSGLVAHFVDPDTFAKYGAGLGGQPATSPLRPYYGSPTAHVVVHLTQGVTPDVEAKVKAVVDGL